MKRGLVALGVAGVLLVGVAPTASADPAPVDISQVAATPVEDLIFPEANADGSVVQRGKEFTLAADVFFAYNDAKLNAKAGTEITRITGLIKESGATKLTVVGHTDCDGSDSANLALSQRRAESVRHYLINRGIAANRLDASGKGENSPVASNSDATGRQMNRRVEVVIANPVVSTK